MIDAHNFIKTLRIDDVSFLKNISLIKIGCEGAVMRCEIDGISISLVVKMHFNFGSETEVYMNMCSEAKILREIPNHPNIIFLIHDFFARPTQEMIFTCVKDRDVREIMRCNGDSHQNEYRTSLFLIFKAYPSDLQKWMVEKRNNCQMIDIIRICYEISCGILHLWNHGVVHRSLKLNDILIDDEGHIVIIDFGMAVKLDVNGKAFVLRNGGNQAHLAPEVLNCDFSRGGKIEVDYSKQPSFALGVLFHEILTGYHPFDMYPLDPAKYGREPNISVPPLDFERINNIKNFVVDEKFTFMIRDLLLPFSNRMTLKDCNVTLSKLFGLYEIEENIKLLSTNESFEFIGRTYTLSYCPIPIISRLIYRISHFSGMKILKQSDWNFHFYSEEDGNYNDRNFHIFIKWDENNKNHPILHISIFYPKEEENYFYCLFLLYIIFASPHEILLSYNYHFAISFEQIILLNNQKQEIGTENDLLMDLNGKFKYYQKYIFGDDIKVFGSDLFHFKFVKYLNKNHNNYTWIGTLKELGKREEEIVFKEPISITFENLRAMLNEVTLSKMIENEFTLKLIGICFPTNDLLNSRINLETQSNKMIGLTSKEDYLNHQMLMIVEKSPFGSLADCFDEIKKCSISLKLKIAFDIARGIYNLFLKSGMRVIHRNIKPENIFIFSMDEHSTDVIYSIHAKLGNFGRSVIGKSPNFQSDDFKYSAPETSKRISFSSILIDVYSFGILLWQLLSGKIPYYDLKGDIKEQIIKGSRPSLNDLPSEITQEHEEIVELIKACWDANPSARPNFGKIISILYPYFHIGMTVLKQRYIKYISETLEVKQIIGKKLNASMFSCVKLASRGCTGLVMICNLNLGRIQYKVALKMLMNFYSEIKSGMHRKTINEFNIIPDDIQHPNIICKYESFISIPTDEMIQFVDEFIRDICYDELHEKKKHQFYVLQAHEETLESMIDHLTFEQIMKFSYQLSSALLFLFKKNIVHLDIKLEKLMISSTGDLVIIGFSCAGRMDKTGFVLIDQTHGGNPYHLAPEVLQAKQDHKNLPCSLQHSWELGMIIFEMFNKGTVPFEPYYYNIFLNTPALDLSKISSQLQFLVSKLLCPAKERLSIEAAHEILLKLTVSK